MKRDYLELAGYLKQLLKLKNTLLIAIDGPGGSGKSFFAENLCRRLHNAVIVHFDDFYLESKFRINDVRDIGGDFDWKRLEKQVLIPIRNKENTRYQKYNWSTDSLDEWHRISRNNIVIIEGIYSTRAELHDYYDLKIWVEVDRSIRLLRGVERDGVSMKNTWLNDWMPKEDLYIQSSIHSPRENADMIVEGLIIGEEAEDSFIIVYERERYFV